MKEYHKLRVFMHIGRLEIVTHVFVDFTHTSAQSHSPILSFHPSPSFRPDFYLIIGRKRGSAGLCITVPFD